MAEHATTNLISKVKLPGSEIVYDIHDATALHEITPELITPIIGELTQLMNFKGTKPTKNDLPTSDQAVGDVWHVLDTDSEWIWVGAYTKADNTTVAAHWEEMGATHNHVHSVNLSKNNTITIPALTVTASQSDYTPDLTVTKKAITASAPDVSKPNDTVLGEATTFKTSVSTPTTQQKGLGTVTSKTYKIKMSRSGDVAVGSNGTAAVITGITPTSSNFITAVTPGTQVDVVTKYANPSKSTALIGLGTPDKEEVVTGYANPTTAAAVTGLNTTSFDAIKSIGSATASKVTVGTTTATGDVGDVTTTANKTTFSVADGLLTINNAAGTIGGSVSTKVPTVTAVDVSASVVTKQNITNIATGTPKTTDVFMKGLGTPTTVEAITSIDPTTGTFLTGLGTASTTKVLPSFTTSTSSALTGLGTPDKATVLTGVTVTGQPEFTAQFEDTSNAKATDTVSVVTGVGSSTITISTPTANTYANKDDVVTAVTDVTVAAPALTNADSVVTNVVGKAKAVTVGGTTTAKDITATISISGDTGSVKSNTEH